VAVTYKDITESQVQGTKTSVATRFNPCSRDHHPATNVGKFKDE